MTTIELRPGEGGDDAAAFADELQAAIEAYLRRAGHPGATSKTEGRVLTITTSLPRPDLDWLAGTHRVQRVPSGSSARHTSTATVAVLDDESKGVSTSWVCPREVRVDRYRGSGPGGQRKNKVATAVRLVHEPTGITVTRESGRSQADNLRSAQADLASRLDARASAERSGKRARDRQQQVRADRSAKSFTHNHQRGEVKDHSTERTWSIKAWQKGKF